MIRLYVDEDSMDRALVRALRARGVEITTALAEDMIEQSDAAHLEYATSQGRVLYTCNVADFYQLHTEYLAQNKSHAGMILAHQQRYSVGEQMRRLLKLINMKPMEEMKNWIEFL
jgi:hypothetical protein